MSDSTLLISVDLSCMTAVGATAIRNDNEKEMICYIGSTAIL